MRYLSYLSSADAGKFAQYSTRLSASGCSFILYSQANISWVYILLVYCDSHSHSYLYLLIQDIYVLKIFSRLFYVKTLSQTLVSLCTHKLQFSLHLFWPNFVTDLQRSSYLCFQIKSRLAVFMLYQTFFITNRCLMCYLSFCVLSCNFAGAFECLPF